MKPNYDDFHFDEKYGLYYDDDLIADFNLSVIDKKTLLGPSGIRGRPSYLIEISYTDGRPKLEKWVERLKNLDLFELFEIDDSFFSAEIYKLLLSKLMQEAGRIPERVIIDSQEGLQNVVGIPVYVLCEYTLCHGKPPEKHEIVTHHTMKPIQYTDRKELLSLCEAYIRLLPGVTELLFFGSLCTVIAPFLNRINIKCNFLLALVAPSGHLKTTLARIYSLWLESETEQETSFYSRQRDSEILNAIDKLPGQNFLIDDLHYQSNANESARQKRRLDIVSRHVDSKNNCANVILTGETMEKMGIFSCMDRIFQVRIPVMDAAQIENLKAKVSSLSLNLMPSVVFAFVQALMDNYDTVLDDMQEFYAKYSIENDASGYSTRVHRHALFIRMTEYLFEKYLFCSELQISGNKEALNSAIDKQLDLQWKELQKIRSAEESHDYIVELYQIITTGKPYITVCGRPSEYQQPFNSCLVLNDKIYITTNALKGALYKYHQRYMSPKPVIDVFHKEGLLEEEPGSRGRQKNYQGQKHYVIPLCPWINYLHRNGHYISDKDYDEYIKPYL